MDSYGYGSFSDWRRRRGRLVDAPLKYRTLNDVPPGATVRAEGYVVAFQGRHLLDKVPNVKNPDGSTYITAGSPEIFGETPEDRYISIRGMWQGDGLEVREWVETDDLRKMPPPKSSVALSWVEYLNHVESIPERLSEDVTSIGAILGHHGLPHLAIITAPLITEEWVTWSTNRPVVLDPVMSVED